jgi:hypothetical protein
MIGTAKNAELRALIQDIGAKAPSLTLDQLSKDELVSDVATLEARIASPVPKQSIIAACLISARATLEIAAGDIVAVALIHQIAKYKREGSGALAGRRSCAHLGAVRPCACSALALAESVILHDKICRILNLV